MASTQSDTAIEDSTFYARDQVLFTQQDIFSLIYQHLTLSDKRGFRLTCSEACTAIDTTVTTINHTISAHTASTDALLHSKWTNLRTLIYHFSGTDDVDDVDQQIQLASNLDKCFLQLQHLQLHHTPSTVIPYLATQCSLPNLRHLGMQYWDFTQSSIEQLCKAPWLLNLETLTAASMWYNEPDDYSLTCALKTILPYCTQLQDLTVFAADDKLVASVCVDLPNLQKLAFTVQKSAVNSTGRVTGEGLGALAEFATTSSERWPLLHTLILRQNYRIGGKGVVHLAKVPWATLQRLELYRCGCTSRTGVTALIGNTALTSNLTYLSLSIVEEDDTEEGVETISQGFRLLAQPVWKSLKELEIEARLPSVSGSHWAQMKLPKIQKLTLHLLSSEFARKSVTGLVKAPWLPQLTHLNFAASRISQSAFLVLLSRGNFDNLESFTALNTSYFFQSILSRVLIGGVEYGSMPKLKELVVDKLSEDEKNVLRSVFRGTHH